MKFASPLRYPGGKGKLSDFVRDIVLLNDIQGGTYIEPFAGGASVALKLLFSELVNDIVINDIDRSIYAFWYCVLNHTDELCERISETPVSIELWREQKDVQRTKETADIIDLAFSTFFLNRTNRSGIIKGGVIGGNGQQGEWKMDVRFNKKDLIERIVKIAQYRDRIDLHCQDAIQFVNGIMPGLDEHTLIYFDPPYYNKGSALYVNHYGHQDHLALSNCIHGLDCKWLLTYDYTPQIIDMYRNSERRMLTLNYTAAIKEKGYEMIAFSDDLTIPIHAYSSISID